MTVSHDCADQPSPSHTGKRCIRRLERLVQWLDLRLLVHEHKIYRFLFSTEFYFDLLPVIYVFTLTLKQLLELVCDPSRSCWLWPANQSLMPVPAHWRQHSKRSMLGTSELGSYEWKAFISSPTHIVTHRLIVSEIQHQERPHQHHF